MTLRAVVRVVLPLAVAAGLCLHGVAQTTPDAPAPAPATVPVQGASTIGSSTDLTANSNALTSLYGTPVEQIIARVNDQVITNSDVARAQTQLDQEARQNNWTLEQINQGQANLLRDLIDQQLLISKGKQLGITGDTELIKRLDEIRKENHLDTLDDLEKAVEQQGISYEDFKANIRNSIITQQVVRDEVGSKMQISEAEIRAYYNDHQADFTHEESVHLNEILIPTSENATGAELTAADAEAKKLEAKLKSGASFTDLAKKYSKGPTAQQGGDLGDFRRGALAKVLEDQTFDLPVGGHTAPIRTRQGYIILQVTEHIPGGTAPMQKVEPQIEQAIYMKKIGPAVRQYLTRLRDEAYIDIRPGYTDSAASPDETKPTFAAYTPPQPKKKKKQKARYDGQMGRYGRGTLRAKTPVQVASATTPETSSAVAARSSSAGKKSHLAKKHEAKREKFRFGHAPAAPVSAEQVATSVNAPPPPSPENPTSTADSAPGTDVQPLGPDLEHVPLITQPKVGKTRFSDQARNKSETATRKHPKTSRKTKKVKHDNAKAAPLPTTETATRQMESAPLGLNGATAAKKKKKKTAPVNPGEKTRLSDQKKSKQKKKSNGQGTQTTPASSDTGGSGGTTSPSTPPPAASSSPANQS
ncbi:MAG: peptidylprolyl isomerase [Acidobacteriaceae bacterium]